MELGDLAIIRPWFEWFNEGTKDAFEQDDFNCGDIVIVLESRDFQWGKDDLHPPMYRVGNLQTGKTFWITYEKLEKITEVHTREWEHEVL